jgi:hypothetical protein
VAVRIEGIGDTDGQWSFCAEAPAYGDASWKPWLVTLPTFLSERVDMSGGVPQAGSCSVELLDAGDALTSLLRTESEAYTVLDEAVDLTETSIEVSRNTSLDGKVIWVGSEAMLVTGVASSPTRITVQRAYLGTEATIHATDDPVHLYPNYLEGRRFGVVLADLDATSSAGEVLLGTYLLDSIRWSSALNAWDLRGTSQQRYLDRQMPLAPRASKILGQIGTPPRVLELEAATIRASYDHAIESHDARWGHALAMPCALSPNPCSRSPSRLAKMRTASSVCWRRQTDPTPTTGSAARSTPASAYWSACRR